MIGIVSDKQIKRGLRFGDVCIKFFYKKSLANLPPKNILEAVVVRSGYLKISSPELTAMDLLSYPNPSRGINHTATVLSEIVEKIDPKKKVIYYFLLLWILILMFCKKKK